MSKEDALKELDLISMLKPIWLNRKSILKSAVYCLGIGLIISFLLPPKRYKSSITFIHESASDGKSPSGLSGLANLTGFKLPTGDNSLISDLLYERIIHSRPFLDSLSKKEINFSRGTNSFKQFYKDEYEPGVLEIIEEYTVGLPWLIKDLLKGSSDIQSADKTSFLYFSGDELELLELLKSYVVISLNEEDGSVKLSAEIHDRFASAELTQVTFELLQHYITRFELAKAKNDLERTALILDETQEKFHEAQNTLSTFLDQNVVLSTASAKNELNELQSNYDLTYTVYKEISTEYEQARLSFLNKQPSFHIIEPIVIPDKPVSIGKAKFVIVFTILLVFLRVILLYLKLLWEEFKSKI